MLQEGVSVIYFLNRSECVPVLTSSSICNSLLSVFLYINNQSGLIWHSLHPTNSPCKAWSLFLADKETSFASFKTISLSSSSGKFLRLAILCLSCIGLKGLFFASFDCFQIFLKCIAYCTFPLVQFLDCLSRCLVRNLYHSESFKVSDQTSSLLCPLIDRYSICCESRANEICFAEVQSYKCPSGQI